MKPLATLSASVALACALALSFLAVPSAAEAQWRATVGAQDATKGQQVMAFLPNELWIHAGESVTWTSAVDEIHTVTFLVPGQTRQPFDVGCPGFVAGAAASFDGSTCVTTPPLAKSQSLTVSFPTGGNFKLVCLVHESMTGVVHVLDAGEPLPHAQSFYDDQAVKQRQALLSDDDHAQQPRRHRGNAVTAGIGEIVANGGGAQTLSVVRFMTPKKVIHVGETVEWTNLDPVTPHTITFGQEPANPVAPVNVTQDPDGALHGIVSSAADNVHSGLIGAAPQERLFDATTAVGTTRFRVTFTHAGVFHYVCALHDGLGMVGEVDVLP